MDLDIQLKVTDQELEKFPEEDTANRWDTHSPARQPLVHRRETLIQLSEPLILGKETLVQLGVPGTLPVT